MISAPDGNTQAAVDSRWLHALGVLVPIRFQPVKVLPGRHPLGHTGDGMRLLRTRPYIPAEDNPRDIDKFSSPEDRQVMEWEDEAQASITILVDNSASMNSPLKLSLRNMCVLQMIYSMWRAGDRVGIAMFDTSVRQQVRAANLKSQIQQSVTALQAPPVTDGTNVSASLCNFVRADRRRHSNLLFVVSDFLSRDIGHTPDPLAAWRPAINELQRSIVPVIVSFSLAADTKGVIKLWDPERRARRLAWFDKNRVKRINRHESARVSALRKQFRSAGLDSMRLRRQAEVFPELSGLARIRRQRRN